MGPLGLPAWPRRGGLLGTLFQEKVLIEVIRTSIRRKHFDALEREGRHEAGGLLRVREVAEPIGGVGISPRKDVVSWLEITWIDGGFRSGEEVCPGNYLLSKPLEAAKLPYGEGEDSVSTQMPGELDEESLPSLIARDMVQKPEERDQREISGHVGWDEVVG